MQYRSYVIIFVIRPCGKREVGHRPRHVNSDVQRVYTTTGGWLKKSSSSEIMSQPSTLNVNMVKDRQPKYCYLNLSDNDDEETDLFDKINFKIMCAMPLTMSMAARLTRIVHIVIHVVMTI